MSAWPALADLMTILALLSLAIAAGALSVMYTVNEPQRKVEDLLQETAEANRQLRDARNEIADLEKRLEQEASAGEEESAEAPTIGGVSCLGIEEGPQRSAVSLLRIVVEETGYRVTGIWPGRWEIDVGDIPMVHEVIERGLVHASEFTQYAGPIFDYGYRSDTFNSSCRFFIELENESTVMDYVLASISLERYFLFANSAEVMRIRGNLAP